MNTTPQPYPDEVFFDEVTCELVVNGPVTQTQKNAFDYLAYYRYNFVEGIAWLEKRKRRRKIWLPKSEALLVATQRAVELIDCALPSLELRRTPGFNMRKWCEQQPPIEKQWSKYLKHIEPGFPGSVRISLYRRDESGRNVIGFSSTRARVDGTPSG